MSLKKLLSRIVLAATILSALSGLSITYADDSRWALVEKRGTLSWSVDKNTIKRYSPYNGDMEFWLKIENNYGGKDLYKYIVLDVFRTEYRYYNAQRPNKSTYYHPVCPDSIQEKVINTALALSGGGTVFPQTEHTWKWIYSDDIHTYSICTDTYEYNEFNNSAFVYVLEENSRHWKNYIYYCTFFSEPAVYKGENEILGKKLEIIPESLAEAVLNASKELVQN